MFGKDQGPPGVPVWRLYTLLGCRVKVSFLLAGDIYVGILSVEVPLGCRRSSASEPNACR